MCCTTLQEATSCLAILDFVISALICLPVGWLLYIKTNSEFDEFQQDAILVVILWTSIGVCVLQTIFATYLILTAAASRRNDYALKTWIKLTVVVMILLLSEIFIVALIAAMRNRSPFWDTGGYYGEDCVIAITIQLGGLCVKFGQVCVVYRFRKELYQSQMCLKPPTP